MTVDILGDLEKAEDKLLNLRKLELSCQFWAFGCKKVLCCR